MCNFTLKVKPLTEARRSAIVQVPTQKLRQKLMYQTYFHLNPEKLNEGDVIPKGYWGVQVNEAARKNLIIPIQRDEFLHKTVIIEHLLEETRRLKFPHLPSRFDCIFACLSKDEALQFSQTPSHRNYFLYEVEPVISSPQTYVAEIEATNIFRNKDSLASIAQNTELYWTHIPSPNAVREVLIPCDIRVIAVHSLHSC